VSAYRDVMPDGVQGGTLKCQCGRLYHVSIFREVLKRIAEQAYATATPEGAREEAIEAGYRYGREIERSHAESRAAAATHPAEEARPRHE
jgi:ketopantoate reductase